MHGIVFQQVKNFVVGNFSLSTWEEILDKAQLSGKMFMPTSIYPDKEAQALIAAISAKLNLPATEVLEKFGEYLSGNLIKIYAASISQGWRTLDLLEHTENTMHKAVRFADKNATPPKLVCKRLTKDKVCITYTSERLMADLGVGLIKGFAKHYNERIQIDRKDSNSVTELFVTRLN
jgi:hypothetical protein